MHTVRDGLESSNLIVWSDESLEPGSQDWRAAVQEAIENARCMVAILSPDAKSSQWVNEEIGYARARRMRIFTVLVSGDESNAVPLGVASINWIDMRADYEFADPELVRQSATEKLLAAVKEYLGKD
jgi:hypothetical protein